MKKIPKHTTNSTTKKPALAREAENPPLTPVAAPPAGAPLMARRAMKSTEAAKHQDPLCVAVGTVIYRRRVALKLTLDKCAERSGVARQTITFLECGTHRPRLDILESVAQAVETVSEQLVADARALLPQCV